VKSLFGREILMKNRDVASILMGITVAWNMYGFATNFFNRAWREAPVPVVPISYTLNAAIAVFAPLARSGKRWVVLASTVLGVLMAVWSAVGVFFVADEETELAPGVPAVAGPGVAAILGALIALFCLRARREE
jgi:hypothetical protein